jgi:hypothetical protein
VTSPERSRGPDRAAWRGAYLAAVVAAVVASGWILTRPQPFALGGDNATLLHPLLADAYRQVRAGRLPLWTAGRWGGSPLLGDPTPGALYPPYYLGFAVSPLPHPRALDVVVCLHLIFFACGVVWLLRVLGVRPAVALLAAALAVLNPTIVTIARSWIHYWTAMAWWPWLWGAAALLAGGARPAAAWLATAALAAQVYAGYPQFALYSGTVACLWIVTAPGPHRRRRAALAAVVGLGAVALAAPQVLPALDMTRGSMRAGPDAAARMAAYDEIFALSAATWPGVFQAAPPPVGPSKLFPGTLVLAAIGAVRGGFAARFLAAVAVVGAVLATSPPGVSWLLRTVPPFRFFGGPVKFFYLAAFAALALAGLGLEALVAPARGRRLAAAALALAAVPAVAAAGGVPALAGLALVAAAAVATSRGAAGVGALAAGGAFAFLVASRALTAPHAWGAALFGPFQVLLERPPPFAAPPPAATRPIALTTFGDALHQVGLDYGSLWGVETWNGVGPLARWRQLDALEKADARQVVDILRQIGGSPAVVASGGPLEATLERAGFHGPPPADGLRVLTDPTPRPRYELAQHAYPADAEVAIAAARTGRAFRGGVVLVEAASLDGGETGDFAGRVDVLAYRPADARLRVTVDRPTWLVAREPYYANWEATVDGRRATVHPAAGFLLAFLVDAGRHEVRLRYREPGLATGVAVAVAGAALLAFAFRRLSG